MVTLKFVQVRQEIAQEFENVKDISSTLASFKADNVRPSFSVLDDHEPFRREEPTRDPDVWPPPTPVEHRYVCLIIFFKQHWYLFPSYMRNISNRTNVNNFILKKITLRVTFLKVIFLRQAFTKYKRE